jgi:hypothetical protein
MIYGKEMHWQSYIADIEWNISDYNDIWKGNALILC